MNAKVTPALGTPTDLKSNAVGDIAGALRILLADVFALYIKTKNFHWHMSGPHFRDYHLLLDEQADQIFAMTDDIAERARKIGGTTLRSIGQIDKLKRVLDNDAEFVTPLDMLAELRDDNKQLTVAHARGSRRLRRARRRRHHEPARELDRRGRAAHLVPVRGLPERGIGNKDCTTAAGCGCTEPAPFYQATTFTEAAIALISAPIAGYFPAIASTLPISTSSGMTPGHSVLAPRNQHCEPLFWPSSRAV